MPLKPVLDGEPSYEDIPQGLHNVDEPRWQIRVSLPGKTVNVTSVLSLHVGTIIYWYIITPDYLCRLIGRKSAEWRKTVGGSNPKMEPFSLSEPLMEIKSLSLTPILNVIPEMIVC